MAEELQDGAGTPNEGVDRASSMPKDAQVVSSILKDMGVTSYEPRVINQLLEFIYRYITDVLEDAKLYSSHAGNNGITKSDVKFAIETKLDHAFTTPPPRDFLVDLAQQKNQTPLPTLKTYMGARLPPDRYCLSSLNYRLKSQVKAPKKILQGRNSTSTNGQNNHNQNQSNFRTITNPHMMVAPGKRKWQEMDDYDT